MHIYAYFAAPYDDSTFTLIIIKSSEDLDIQLFASLLKLLKTNGRIAIPSEHSEEILERLKLAGFINVTRFNNCTFAKVSHCTIDMN